MLQRPFPPAELKIPRPVTGCLGEDGIMVYRPEFAIFRVEDKDVKLDLKACASQAACCAVLRSRHEAGSEEPLLILDEFPGGVETLKDIIRYMQANAAEERAAAAAAGQLGVPAGVYHIFRQSHVSIQLQYFSAAVSWSGLLLIQDGTCDVMLGRLGKSLDFYAILGVETTASEAELRSAYRRQALRTHPDKGGSAEAFRQVLHSFEVLSSIRARAKYDLLRCQPREDAAPGRCPERKRRKTTGEAPEKKPREPEEKATAAKDGPKDQKIPKAKVPLISKITKSLMRLRRLALAMTSTHRKEALSSDLSTELKEMLLEFMTTYGKTGVPTATAEPEGSEGARDAKVFKKDPAADQFSSGSDSESGGEDSEPVDQLEHLSDVTQQGEAPAGCSLGAHLSDDSSDAPLALEDAEVQAEEAPKPKEKRAYGRSGMRGVSRRMDSKTSTVSYQASVSFENVSFRSKYHPDIQAALDCHIVSWSILGSEWWYSLSPD
eukprot:s1235_g11.t1